jgi:ElaB/YqjD/DUF883 family membrane-anchored ribosome-binding protein
MDKNKIYLNELKDDLKNYKKKFTSIKNSLGGKSTKKSDKLMGSLEEIMEEAGESYDKLFSASEDEWESIKKVTGKVFENLKKNFEEGSEYLMDGMHDIEDSVSKNSEEAIEWGVDYIKKHPFKSVLMAGLVGIIMGRVLK